MSAYRNSAYEEDPDYPDYSGFRNHTQGYLKTPGPLNNSDEPSTRSSPYPAESRTSRDYLGSLAEPDYPGSQSNPDYAGTRSSHWFLHRLVVVFYTTPDTEAKVKGEKESYTHLNAEFQRIARRDKKAFLSDQYKEIEENNRMG